MITWLKSIFFLKKQRQYKVTESSTILEKKKEELLQNNSIDIHSDISFDASLQNQIGDDFFEKKDYLNAELHYRNALLVNPKNFEAWINLGLTLDEKSNYRESENCYRNAIKVKSNSALARFNLGVSLKNQYRLVESEAYLRQAIDIWPIFFQCHNVLGEVLQAQRRNDEAIVFFQNAIMYAPDFVHAYKNLGQVLVLQARFLEAKDYYLKALKINPSYANAHTCLGDLYMQNGQVDQAIEYYRTGILLDPDYLVSHSNFLMTLSFHSKCTPAHYLNEVQLYANKVTKLARPYTNWLINPVDTEKPILKIGFVSGDFNYHPVGFFLESVVEQINIGHKVQLDLFAYSNNVVDDALTLRLKSHFKSWNQIKDMGDQQLAKKIHEDGVHILIDLSGHTANNRLPVFSWKPAPVQVSWLGYFASTGVSEIDYVFSDIISVPLSHQVQFTEEIYYLPNTRLCFTAPEKTVNEDKFIVTSLPALKNGFITFGCFQRMAKITDEVLMLWGEIFENLPNARLRLQNKHMNCPVTQQQMLVRLESFGIKKERVDLCELVNREQYLLDHAYVDMILDTFPYTGGTTTCEALWMGVPTLTLNGDTMLKRQGASLLKCAGLGEWVADDKNTYVSRAVYFANRLDDLDKLRADLRKKVLASPIFDAPLFVRNLEKALLDIWFKKKNNLFVDDPIN